MTTTTLDPREILKNFAAVYVRYLRNPVQEIRNLPDWSWRDLVVNQVIVTAATGALSGILKGSFLSIIQGLIVVPIITAVTITVATLFFYFVFQILAGTTLHYRRLTELIFFANIPFFIFSTVSHWFPPASLFGLAMAGFLMIVGLCENFQLQRRLVLRTVIGVYLLFLLVWIWGRMDAMRVQSRMEKTIEAPAVELGQ